MYLNNISGKTQATGIFGYPIGHTLSPLMHNTAFNELGLDYVYLPFEVQPHKLKEALTGIRALNIRGVNVTTPHKIMIMLYLDDISEDARAIGAVNTIVNEDEKLLGYNTDIEGFLAALLPMAADLKGKKATVLGAGGAARAVIYGLIMRLKISELVIINRTLENAEQLVYEFRDKIPGGFPATSLFPGDAKAKAEMETSKLIVNTTSMGMMSETSPISDPGIFTEAHIAYDLVYRPVETTFLKQAGARGARTIDGLEMLIHQGSSAFRQWIGREMPVDSVRWALMQELGGNEGVLIADV